MRNRPYEKALDLVGQQKTSIRKLQGVVEMRDAQVASLRALATAKNKKIEDLKYKLQLSRDEIRELKPALEKAQATDSAQELLLTGLHDLNVRVGKLEAWQWQEGEGQ